MQSDAQIQFFTGKGGVGKSSVVAASALVAARAGRRPLVVELSSRHSMPAFFGVSHLPTHEPRRITGLGDPEVYACTVDLEEALVDYITEHAKVRSLSRRVVANEALQRFFFAAPAVAEVATLRCIERWASQQGACGLRWDPVLVDLDATGHALMFVSLPQVFDDIVRRGPLARTLNGFREMLEDPARSVLHVVTLPEALPVEETEELLDAVDALPITLGTLFLNRVPAPPLSQTTLEVLAGLPPELAPEVALAKRLIGRHARAEELAQRLARRAPSVTRLPWLEPFDLQILSRVLGGPRPVDSAERSPSSHRAQSSPEKHG